MASSNLDKFISDNMKVMDPVWNITKTEQLGNKKIYSNGDVFQGQFNTETGLPSYGVITFLNGNVYEGPIHYSWPQDADDTFETYGEYDETFDENYDETFVEAPVNEGIMTYPDGKTFIGVFCFGKAW
jgi:hypothetical protein